MAPLPSYLLDPTRTHVSHSTRCESRAEVAAIAAIADDIGRRNRTRLNPPPNPARRGALRELSGISSTAEMQLAPRDFADARVSFTRCERAINLDPHPSLMTASQLSVADAGLTTGLRAAPIEDRSYSLMTPRTR